MRRLIGGMAGLVLACIPASAQLQPGDVAVIAYTTHPADSFAWVALRDMPSNTVVCFTSSSVSNGWFRWGDHLGRTVGPGPLTWTSTNFVPAGTVVSWISGTPKCWSMGLISGGVPQLSIEGDQLFAYTGSIVSNSAGISPWLGDPGAASLVFGLNFANAGWDNVTGGGANTSFIPFGLSTNSGTAVHAGSYENGYYSGSRSGTRAELLAAISVSSNWTVSAGIINPSLEAAPFTVMPPSWGTVIHFQ